MKKVKKVSFIFVFLLFASIRPASALLPSNELWREDLINSVVGFAEHTTGGRGGSLCQVTNLNDSGAGSLRACAEAQGPMWIVFTVSGTINLQSVVHVTSHKTIDGRGQNIIVSNRGFTIGTWTDGGSHSTVTNVIIHNIQMKSNRSNGMIIIAEDASNVWIDHNTFQDAVDEIIYVGSGSGFNHPAPYNITISWNRCATTTPGQGWADKCILVSDPSDTPDVNTTITLHHNHYQTYIRHPLARYAKIHAFNNYCEATGRCYDLYTDVQLYSENEIFRLVPGAANPTIKLSGNEPWDPRGAANVKVVNPLLLNGATIQQINPSTIFNPASYYSYIPDTANAALQAAIASNGGWQNVTAPPPPTPPQAPSNLVVK